MTTLTVLPTVWLRDLRVLSYISGGVIASILVVLCLFWVGHVDQVGTHSKGTTQPYWFSCCHRSLRFLLFRTCCFSEHLYLNGKTKPISKGPLNMGIYMYKSFVICTLMYAGVAVMGYSMFGESTLSQFTLNVPQDLVASKITVWTTVVNPFTKYALTICHVALSLEELIPSNPLNKSHSHTYAICIRTAVVFSALFVGLAIPFFGLVCLLMGSLLTMLFTLILPCTCLLSIVRGKVTRSQVCVCILIIVVGVVSSVTGTYSALFQIIEKLRS